MQLIAGVGKKRVCGGWWGVGIVTSGAPIYRLSIVSGRYLAVSVNIVSADNPLKKKKKKNLFVHYPTFATLTDSGEWW